MAKREKMCSSLAGHNCLLLVHSDEKADNEGARAFFINHRAEPRKENQYQRIFYTAL